jgi:hypothetical protein
MPLPGCRRTRATAAPDLHDERRRDHARDRDDLQALVGAGPVDPARLWDYFREIEPALYRFPAIDPAAFRARVDQARTLGQERGIER